MSGELGPDRSHAETPAGGAGRTADTVLSDGVVLSDDTVLSSGVVLSDGVVTVRPLGPADAAEHLAGEDSESVRWLNDGAWSTGTTVTAYLELCERAWAEGGPIRAFAVVDVRTGSLAGVVEAQRQQPSLEDGEINLSYSLYPTWRGRGRATRAVVLVCRWIAMSGFGDSAVIRTDPDNAASAGVARRAGFVPVVRRDETDLRWWVRPLR